MRFRYRKFFARWRDQDHIDHRKGFFTQREAKQHQQKMREEVRALKRIPGDGRVTNFTLAWMGIHRHSNDQAAGKKMIAIAGSLALRELNGMICEIAVGQWRKSCRSPHTLYNYRFAFRRLLKYLISHGAPADLLLALPRVDEPDFRDVTLNDEERFLLIDQCKPPKFELWFRCFLFNCLFLGLRRTESLRLAPCHYDSVSQRFYGLRVKNNKRHGMRVPGPLREIFDSIEVPEGAEQTSYVELLAGAHITSWAIVRRWKKLKRATGIRQDVKVHDLRRTGASYVMESEGLLAAKEFLHHKSLGNTEAYLAFTRPKDLDRVLEDFAAPAKMLQFPPVARKKSGSK